MPPVKWQPSCPGRNELIVTWLKDVSFWLCPIGLCGYNSLSKSRNKCRFSYILGNLRLYAIVAMYRFIISQNSAFQKRWQFCYWLFLGISNGYLNLLRYDHTRKSFDSKLKSSLYGYIHQSLTFTFLSRTTSFIVNTSLPSDAYMRLYTWPSLVKIMGCCQFGNNVLS